MSEWGERRQPSPNDAGVILSDRLAEREEYVQHFANVLSGELCSKAQGGVRRYNKFRERTFGGEEVPRMALRVQRPTKNALP